MPKQASASEKSHPSDYTGNGLDINRIERYTVLLKDGKTCATIYPVSDPRQLPVGLLVFLCDEFNYEIERGETTPLYETLDLDTFQNYWFGSYAGVMLLGDSPNIEDRRYWEKECLGAFYVKPNYPGRSSHVCTAEFLVNAGIRSKGIGRTLGDCFLEWAPKLGYSSCVLNLVYETNIPARKLCAALDFRRVGRLKGAGIMKNSSQPVDAYIYSYELVTPPPEDQVGDLRFDRIRYYLETGRYPPRCDRQEKSRLRSSSAHYKIANGKLTLNNREVIGDPARQLEIAADVHGSDHLGINKTTTKIAEKYHWTRIKETAALVIRNCDKCKDLPRTAPAKRQKKDTDIAPEASRVSAPGAVDPDDLHPELRSNELLSADLKFGADEMISAVSEGSGRLPRQYHQYRNEFQSAGIPVDPQVANAFEHVQNGEEIAIARALIQANVNNDDPKFF